MARILVGACIVTTAPASATIITTTLTGNSENIQDNANVFGFGTGQNLSNKDFVETFYTDTSAINFLGLKRILGCRQIVYSAVVHLTLSLQH